MVRHYFVDKSNTIFNSRPLINTGLNPVIQLTYGNSISRALLHFDEKRIQKDYREKIYPDIDKLSFYLEMTNCFSIDGVPYEKDLIRENDISAQRASSFNLILMELPQHFDQGRGFEYQSDFWLKENRSINKKPSNWYYSSNGYVWEVDKDKIDLNDSGLNFTDGYVWRLDENGKRSRINLNGGVYSTDYIQSEFDKFLKGESSKVIATQHFDFGTENLHMDITNYMKRILTGDATNYGFLLMFAPLYESMEEEHLQYVGFFTDHTNTFFHPYIECVYSDQIKDNRAKFAKGVENRLYLYTKDDGMPINLDEMPKCEVNGTEYEVKQATKGAYYSTIPSDAITAQTPSIGYDIWSGIKYNGVDYDDVEMEFEIRPVSTKLSFGTESVFKDMTVPTLYGINFDESINKNEIREITVDFRKKYTTDKKELISNAEYRLYIKDGNREVDVIEYTPIEMAYLNNFFLIFAEDLIPHQYFVDIKVNDGREIRYYKEVLRFNVVSDVTERYQ